MQHTALSPTAPASSSTTVVIRHPAARFFLKWCLRFGTASSRSWAYVLAGILGLIVLIAFLIPVLSYLGLDAIAKPMFFALHAICAQIPSHSFYILGHQMGLCQRNLAIYSSMFLMSLVFAIGKKRLPGIPWWVYVLLILPMAWDGTTQMFGLRESTWALRVVTGTLFGVSSIWFVLPLVHRLLREGHTA